MKLVLAEKPSVAQSIAKVLGAAKREDGYLEGNGYVVSWCVGHLVELAQPEVYDAKYSKWAYADLPIFPMDWQYEVSAGTKKQFGILKKLMAREDVASLVCATDAGREGELIFRLVYHKAGCRKPFERLWISSMEDVAIKEGFENLRSGTEYDALYEAALCRERADWIVGINATRLFSTLYGQTLNVGRVMTPTLAMAVMREAAISAFKPELFYTVQIGLDGFTAASERFKTKAAAEAVKQSCSVAIVQKAECKEKTEKPPALYDLTSLQREANRVLGYTAQQTLDYTQNLYEKKLVTYPRTDSRFLTEDMAHSLTDLVKLAFHTFPVEDVDNIPVHAEQVVNNKKVTDHHAIIPTRELQKCNLSELPKGELAILQLISNRLCVAVGDPHRYAETVIELDCGGTVFSTKGKTVVQDGWKALVQKNDSTKSDENVQTLPSVSVGDEMTVSGTEIKEGKTSHQEHNAVHSASSRGIVPHVDVQHLSGRLDQGVLILALPLDLPAHLAIRHAVYGFPILNGVIMLQYVRCHIVGVVYHPVGVHAVEVVLEVGQEQGAHTHRVDEHIFGTLNVKEADIDAKADEPIRALDMMGTHILRQKQLAAVLEIERLTGRIQLRQSLQKVGIQVGTLQRRKRRCQHIGGYHLIFTLPEDPLPVLLAVPHLAHQEGIKAFALELVAFHHHQLHRAFSVLELCNMLLCGKAGHFLIITEALC